MRTFSLLLSVDRGGEIRQPTTGHTIFGRYIENGTMRRMIAFAKGLNLGSDNRLQDSLHRLHLQWLHPKFSRNTTTMY